MLHKPLSGTSSSFSEATVCRICHVSAGQATCLLLSEKSATVVLPAICRLALASSSLVSNMWLLQETVYQRAKWPQSKNNTDIHRMSKLKMSGLPLSVFIVRCLEGKMSLLKIDLLLKSNAKPQHTLLNTDLRELRKHPEIISLWTEI